MILGIFLKDPFYLYYNPAGRKTLFSYFWLLGTFANSKGPGIFSTQLFYGKWSHGAPRPHVGRPEGRKRVGGAAWYPGRATMAHIALVVQMPSVFASISSSWPKTIYKRGHGRDLTTHGGGDRKHINRESAVRRRRKIGGGTAAGIASSHLSSFTNASSSLFTMRGE